MSDELREMVRNKVAARAGCKTPCRMSVLDCACLNTADAAIALIRAEVLEEAARVAEKTFGEGYHVAAAIRALKERT